MSIPLKLREEMAADPYYQTCARNVLLKDHECKPCPVMRKLIEWDHTIFFAGKSLQEKWAIIPTCWLVHRGGLLNREIQTWIALNRATPERLKELSRGTNYVALKERLDRKYRAIDSQ